MREKEKERRYKTVRYKTVLSSCKHYRNSVALSHVLFYSYQSYVSVSDDRFLVPVPDDVTMDVACLFGCSALTSYNAVRKVAPSIKRSCDNNGEN